MKIAVVAAAGAIALAAEAHADSQPLDYVRATTGTINSFALSAGNVYPAICRPWGGPMWAPVTKPGHSEGWFYDYTGTQFYGMRLTHQPSPWMNDFGQVTVVPVSGPVDEKMESRRSHFSHKSETIRPDYYRVYLGDSDIGFELTAAKRSCVMRITYGDAEKPGFVVDAMGDDGKVEVDREKRRVYGVSARRATPVADDFGNRFVVEFDREIVSVEGGGSWCCVRFAPARRGDVLTARMASSFVDREYAVANLAEVSGRSFDAVRAESAKVWNSVLGRFKAETPDIDRKRMFYTALYRASLFPRAYYDIDARTKKAVHRSPTPGGVFEGPFYVGTGFWDTFRALFPLLNFAYPEVNALMTEGLENSWKEAGWFPEWSSPGLSDCMTGNNSASVIADAWLSGARGKADAETLWQGLVHGANNQHPKQGATGRWGAADYNTLGYVAHDKGRHGTVARTLEYAYDDWCIWQFGKAIGKSEQETAQYRKNAGNWRNVIDPKHRLANGRWRDGKFRDDFNPIKWGDGDFVEGNSLHWTWSVVHDIAGLMEAMGGREAFVAALDDVRQPARAAHALPLQLVWRAVEGPVLGARGDEPSLLADARRVLRRRGQRPDICLVRLERARILSRLPRLGAVRDRISCARTRRDTHAVRQDACHRGEGRIAQPLRRRGGLQRQGGERELAFGGGSGERRQTRVQDVVQTRQDARHHTRGGALFHEQG